ncbi:6093_t:CDS:2 [Entrophospora sp. SA101]|nr:4397_t:CDS:2 [Entrophospora sp. SA101]CAJ0764713.1 6093_t:CDS:2 [Entrophospora sp. SA101]CAJ0878544.1 3372_t:CDS:2 [Entrophospora sp. SA101]
MVGEALFQEPDLLLKSDVYVDLSFDTLVWLLQRDDLSMNSDDFQKVIDQILSYIRWCQIEQKFPTRISPTLVTSQQAAKIASWIDEFDLDTSKEFYDIPYDFNLVVRDSRNESFYQKHIFTA